MDEPTWLDGPDAPAAPSGGYGAVADDLANDDVSELTETEIRNAIVVPIEKVKGRRFGMEVRTSKRKGSRITKISKGGVAEASGLQVRDVIIKINDEDIVGWNHAKVGGYLRSKPIDRLTVIRNAPAAGADKAAYAPLIDAMHAPTTL